MNRTKRQRFVSNDSKKQRWLLSYVNFLTLMVAFLVFVFSVSSLEPKKFEEVSATLLQIFDVRPTQIDQIKLHETNLRLNFFEPLRQPVAMPATQVGLYKAFHFISKPHSSLYSSH